MKVEALFRYVGPRSFDTSTAEGRSGERYRRVGLSFLSSLGVKGVSIATTLITVPLTIGYLGSERYGLWITMSSVIALFSFADLGIGHGLLNAISEANGKEDRHLAQQYVSSAFFALAGLAAILGILFAILYPIIPWGHVFNVKSAEALAEAGPATAVLVGCTLLSIPLGIVQRVHLGYQESFMVSLWTGWGSLLALAGLVIAIWLRLGLLWLVLAMAGAPVLALVTNSLVLFGIQRTWLRPRLDQIKATAAKRIVRLGFLFFVLNLAGAIGYQSDSLVIAQILGPDQVTQFFVPMKLFFLVNVALSFVLIPLWPAYTEALTRGDLQWVRRTFSSSVIFSFSISAASAVGLVIWGAQIVRLWVGTAIQPSFLLLVALGLWMVVYNTLNAVAMFLNGAGIIVFQVITSLLMAGVNLALSILLVFAVGIRGVLLGTVVALVACELIPSAFYIPRLLSSLQASAASADSAARGPREQLPHSRDKRYTAS